MGVAHGGGDERQVVLHHGDAERAGESAFGAERTQNGVGAGQRRDEGVVVVEVAADNGESGSWGQGGGAAGRRQ
nr:hypothetical protein [Rhodococcus sp. NCIMB 12038]